VPVLVNTTPQSLRLYQRNSRKIAFVWIAVQVIKHHICFLTARDPRRRAARIRAVAGVLWDHLQAGLHHLTQEDV